MPILELTLGLITPGQYNTAAWIRHKLLKEVGVKVRDI